MRFRFVALFLATAALATPRHNAMAQRLSDARVGVSIMLDSAGRPLPQPDIYNKHPGLDKYIIVGMFVGVGATIGLFTYEAKKNNWSDQGVSNLGRVMVLPFALTAGAVIGGLGGAGIYFLIHKDDRLTELQ